MKEIQELKRKTDPSYVYDTFLDLGDKWYSSPWQLYISGEHANIQEHGHLFCNRVLFDFDTIYGITFGFPIGYEELVWSLWIKEQYTQDCIELIFLFKLPVEINLLIISFV